MARRFRQKIEPEVDRASVFRRRAKKHARKGDYRKASIALKQLVAIDNRARNWVALGHMLRKSRRIGEALGAYKQGLYLHRQSGCSFRARTVARLMLELAPRDPMAVRFAA